jgi:hypothetical protein
LFISNFHFSRAPWWHRLPLQNAQRAVDPATPLSASAEWAARSARLAKRPGRVRRLILPARESVKPDTVLSRDRFLLRLFEHHCLRLCNIALRYLFLRGSVSDEPTDSCALALEHPGSGKCGIHKNEQKFMLIIVMSL